MRLPQILGRGLAACGELGQSMTFPVTTDDFRMVDRDVRRAFVAGTVLGSPQLQRLSRSRGYVTLHACTDCESLQG